MKMKSLILWSACFTEHLNRAFKDYTIALPYLMAHKFTSICPLIFLEHKFYYKLWYPI